MHAAEGGFISLADALRPRPVAATPVSVADRAPASAVESRPEVPPPATAPPPEQQVAIRAACLFRAAIEDAVDGMCAELVREIAVDIVARELRLADVELASIVRRLIAERFAEEPVRIRVAPSDAGIRCELPVISDPTLAAGDAILECRSGSIDARLGVRLSALLDGFGA